MSRLETTQLSQIIAKKLGSIDPSKFPDENFDYYSIPAFDTGAASLVAGSEIGSAKQIVQPGDVLLSRIVPHIRRAWVVRPNEGHRIIGSGEWIVFRSDRFYPPFLRHLLVSDTFHPEFMRTVSGVGGSLLRARPANVALINVELPPVEEQRRIAAILDQAEALRAKRRQALAKLDTLTQSLFLEMFGDPRVDRSQWPKAKFGSIAKSKLGKMLDKGKHKGQAKMFRYLRNANVQWNRVVTDSLLEMEFSDSEQKKFQLLSGDLLMCEGGEPGRCAVWDGGIEDCFYQKALHRCRISPNLGVAKFFVFLFWELARRDALLFSTSTISHLTAEKLDDMYVILPPLQLQKEFERRVASAESSARIATGHLESLDKMIQSLQHRAFRGEL